MSLILLEDGSFAKDSWPQDLLDAGGRTETSVIGPNDKVPPNFEGIVSWARIVKNDDHKDQSRPQVILYQELDQGENMFDHPVSLRIQGFLRHFAVGIFGDWKGSVADARTAKQSITLVANGHSVPWTATWDAINNLRELVSRVLGSDASSSDKHRQLHFTRLVFTMRRANSTINEIALGPDKDPKGWLARVKQQWAITEKMSFERVENGKRIPCPSMIFNRGDFVDVTVRAEVVASYTKTGKRIVHLFLRLCKLVQLVPARKVPKTAKMQNSQVDASAGPSDL